MEISASLAGRLSSKNIDIIRNLNNYPHHFQKRVGNEWEFEESPMRGRVAEEIDIVIEVVKKYLKSSRI